ncbi:MAG TPA: methylated-DNA--[protein]-cysteine S-methyltransferase [Mycobacteriales bacterium]|nr:methylated-DNA--[protein]-cysteine S-methyltransferase [Mycobacteriales bacterium]
MQTRHATVETTIGPLTLVASGAALTGIYFPQHWVAAERATAGAEVPAQTDPILAETARQLQEYLAGDRTAFDLPTAAAGDDFQHRVWALLAEIPFGATTTYGELAERLGDKKLARMVGRAVGYNPLSIVVPCHRVVGKGGKLTGYAGGLERKRFLLAFEAEPAAAGRLF